MDQSMLKMDEPVEKYHPTGHKILVIDDTPLNVKLLADILSAKGYLILTASSGEEGLAVVEREDPDLVLLDVVMPGMTGYDVCRKIRECPQTAVLPVVLITALNPEQERINGLEAGADDFLGKPINQAELLARVRSLLRVKTFHDQLQRQAEQLADWNKSLEQRLQEHVLQLASLSDVTHLLTAAIDPGVHLQQILTTACQLLKAEAGSILLLDRSSNELSFASSVGPRNEKLRGVRFKVTEGIAGEVIQKRQPIFVNDAQHDPRFLSRIDALTGFRTRSIAAAPLPDRDQILGVIELLNSAKEKSFDEEDLKLLKAFAVHASVAIRNVHIVSRVQEQNHYLHASLGERYQNLIGESPVMQQVIATARRAAQTDVTILLLGESGVGKEVFARSIHAWSPRAAGPFLPVNCVALSDQLLESELFGHEKGAFTGAHQQKKGVFELAQGGTIFLDEIGDMKPDLQAKLLRVLQDHEFVRVGGSHPIRVDLRVIAATNQDLSAAVHDGKFRKDLFFRLNVVSITLPPLRDRKADIPALARHFITRSCRELKRPPMTLAPETEALLQNYDWPGNVREVQNVIERAVVLSAENIIYPEDILMAPFVAKPPDLEAGESSLDLPFHESVDLHKRELIQHAISKAGGNKTRAAALLKLQPTYLSRLLRQLGL
jgi:Nif-specific regulatory protein